MCECIKFPDDFIFGTATASYQVEGGWNEDGKGENIWDTMTHTNKETIRDESNGDVACDSYHLYKEDIRLLLELGVHFYRFSISWSRVLPTGHMNVVNQPGIDYYNNVINELLANNIQPMVTMFHWDLPQPLQNLGGWTNPLMANYFEDYARVLYKAFGDRVKWWNTINEPHSISNGYSAPRGFAPNVQAPGHGEYLAIHTILLSHARAYRLYENEFKATQKGKVSLVADVNWVEPKTNSKEDVELAERTQYMYNGWILHPIYSSTGGYPPVMKEYLDKKSKEEGYNRSRLPSFTNEELQMVKGSWDFMALNHYTTFYTSATVPGPSMFYDVGINLSQNDEYPIAASFWLQVVPWGFRKLLNWISKEYNYPPIIITENGFSDHGELEDTGRINYYASYMLEMLKAMKIDNCNIFGYTAWSLMDNFEWSAGYTELFGLYKVDFSDPGRKRTQKASARFYADVIKNRQIPAQYLNIKIGK